jgi:hypothetical protein
MPTQVPSRDWPIYLAVIALEAVYVGLTLAAPQAPQAGGAIRLSPVQTVLLQLSIAVPYVVAWLVGTRGALDFRHCGASTPAAEGGRGFRSFFLGLAVLIGGGLLSALIGALGPYLPPNSPGAVALVIAGNYAYVLTDLLAMLALFLGAWHLVGDGHGVERDDVIISAVLVVIIAALYVPLVLSNPVRQASASPSVAATYYLPDAVIVITLIVPYLVAWTLGFLTTLRVVRYAPPERDALQRKGIRTFVKGLWVIIFSSILLQLLVSLGGVRLLALGLGQILVLVYAFIGLQIAGFVLISLGSNRLCRPRKVERRLRAEPVQTL